MNSELIIKLLFSGFTVFYAFVFAKSLIRGEILLQQGKGSRISEDRSRFLRFACYHGAIVLIFSVITVSAWLFL